MNKYISLLLVFVCVLTLSCCSREIPDDVITDDPGVEIVPTDDCDPARDASFSKADYLFSVSYAGYTEEKDIYARALNSDKMTENVKYHLPIYKFDTLEELERFKSDLADILSFDGSYDEILSFNDMHADCDEIFFEENTLLLVYVSATSGGYRFGISSIERSDNSLLINVEQINFPEDVTDDMMGWFITVPLSDSSLNECLEFDAVLID